MATLKISPEVEAFNAAPVPEGFERVKIVRNNGPTLRFYGKCLAEVSTNRSGTAPRWTELRLWETPAGNWVAESAGLSDHEKEVDLFDAQVINADLSPVDAEKAVMDFFGWTGPARTLARDMKWRFEEFVD